MATYNEQRTKSIIIYGKKFCFPTCECCFLALVRARLSHCHIARRSIRFVSFFFFCALVLCYSFALLLMVCAVVRSGVAMSLVVMVMVLGAAAVANRLCFY